MSTPDPSMGVPGLGHYRGIVDLLGSPVLGDKTVLWLVDGLFGGYYWDSHPVTWNMPPFNGRWPSSLFASQDPVAIDYLHEAALANNPPSGTFYDPGKTGSRLSSLGVHEHWNNPTDKQYSRNLGTGAGIELVALTATRPPAVVAISRAANQVVLSWQASLGGKLQTATELGASNAWSNVSVLPGFIQGRNTITNDISGSKWFYRLNMTP